MVLSNIFNNLLRRNSSTQVIKQSSAINYLRKVCSTLSTFKMSTDIKSPIPVWLDCDPGHDDAFAILLAAYSPEIDLLGISIVHGNDTVEHCALNAKRFMWACGINDIPVYKGVNAPIVRKAKYCPEIHGIPGEQGVAGMCGYHFPDEEIFSNPSHQIQEGHGVIKMYETLISHPEKVTVVGTGAQTNLAMAIRMFPEIKEKIEKIIFMGGAIGLGNTSVAAEFNIEIDPEAAHVVFHSGIPLVMVPLEVTHSVLVTGEILNRISKIDQFQPISETGSGSSTIEVDPSHPHIEYEEIFKRIEEITLQTNSSNSNGSTGLTKIEGTSAFAKCCTQLLTFFGSTYKSVFSFQSPPLHDPCAIFYVTNPECFKQSKMFVDIEMGSEKCYGRTLCDIHGFLGKEPNVTVCFKVDVDKFWCKMLECTKIANEKSPMNK